MQYRFRAALAPVVLALLASCGGGGPSPLETPSRPVPLAQAGVPDTGTAALRVYQAFYGGAPASSDYFSMSGQATGTLATRFAGDFTSLTDDALAQVVLGNLGVTPTTVNANSYNVLRAAVVQFFAAHGSTAATRGQIVANLANLLAGLEADGTYGAAARAFNTRIDANRTFATDGGNNVASSCVPSVTTGFAASLETGSANSGGGCTGSSSGGVIDAGTGGDGSGSGGGAAAGGGLGKVLGATMQVTDLSDGTVIGEALTDSVNGLVTVKTFTRAGPFLLTLRGRAGARYFDEGRNTMVDFPAGTVLHALVDRWDEHVGVSPLTEAAYRYALNNYKRSAADIRAGRATLATEGDLRGLTAAQVRAANDIVRDAMNLRYVDSYALASAKSLPTPIDASSSPSTLTTSRYGVSAVVNGGLVKSALRFNPALPAPALSFTEEFARDMTDGRLDGFALDSTPASTARSYAAARLPDWSQASAEQLANSVGRSLLPSERSIVDVVHRMSYFSTAPLTDEGFANPPALIVDSAILLSDGSVTLFRTRNGTTTRTDNFATNVKRMFHFSSPNLVVRGTSSAANLDRLTQQAYLVKDDGTVWVWGSSIYCITSYLPASTTAENLQRVSASYKRMPGASGDIILTPVQVPGLSNITEMAVGKYNENWMARDANGDVYVWGRDQFNGTVYRENLLGGLRTRDYTRLASGSVVSTVSLANADPNGSTPGCIPPVRQVAQLPKAIGIAAGTNAQFALTVDGRVFGWGSGAETGFNMDLAELIGSDPAVFAANVQSTPRNLNLPGVVRQLNGVKTDGFSFDLVMATTLTDQVYVWGGLVASPRSYVSEFASGFRVYSPVYRDVAANGTTFFDKVFLREDGVVEVADTLNAVRTLSVPSPVRVLKQVGDRTWLFAKNGRIYEVGAGTTPEDITTAVRNGTR